ncbi:hypothetical protein GCM10011369_23650 [Neiella marina]|uniref:Uncharacterized protein n=1 Tax=Neiella marina TaxID=508461 RepID=A0A8J2U601_9GAMM|nr:hypothetical protein [Neiella marina]GGA80967.1 hypothetical protein GCM10011369_23650 [Neiella marina]
MQVVTITPIRSHLNLRLGVNEKTAGYKDFLDSIKSLLPKAKISKQRSAKAYKSLKVDDRDGLKLFSIKHSFEQQGISLTAHVYSNTVSIIELLFDEQTLPDTDLENWVQDHTTTLINEYYQQHLMPQLQLLAAKLAPKYLEPIGKFSGFIDINEPFGSDDEVEQLWSARSLRLQPHQRQSHADLITEWLSNTPCPEDATAIIAGESDVSMVWLNYVFVDTNVELNDMRIAAMVSAQYVYSVQDICNSNLYETISTTYLEKSVQQAKTAITAIRAITRMHISSFQEARKYLKPEKKILIDEILKGWDFDKVTANSERLIDICSSRLHDIQSTQEEKSSYYTDLILVAIGFISLFDLAITLSEYSRTYTASATLGYRDSAPSSFLTMIATLETDHLLLISFFFIVFAFFIYLYAKRH